MSRGRSGVGVMSREDGQTRAGGIEGFLCLSKQGPDKKFSKTFHFSHLLHEREQSWLMVCFNNLSDDHSV